MTISWEEPELDFETNARGTFNVLSAARAHGVPVPTRGPAEDKVTLQISAIPCPFCDSRSTRLESPFGPTRCRSVYYCPACKNTFEHMKRV